MVNIGLMVNWLFVGRTFFLCTVVTLTDTVESIDFIEKMKSLESLSFHNCKRGDLKPLFKCKSLKRVHILNKRHYTHKQSEINEYLNKKWNKVSE